MNEVNKGITRYFNKDGKEISAEEYRKLQDGGDKPAPAKPQPAEKSIKKTIFPPTAADKEE